MMWKNNKKMWAVSAGIALILILAVIAGLQWNGKGKSAADKSPEPSASPAASVKPSVSPAASSGPSSPTEASLTGPYVKLDWKHPKLVMKEGQPAIVAQGDAYPSLTITAKEDAEISADVLLAGAKMVSAAPMTVKTGESKPVVLTGTAAKPGVYQISVKIKTVKGSVGYDSFSFAVLPTGVPKGDTSKIAFAGEDGKMVYVPDFRGNRIPDFSNSGYKGGGVKIPDVPAKLALAPGDGDDTARIQAAIDKVSAMQPDANGFRGAILLKKGTFKVNGTLQIKAGGVVIRGEGQEENGTVLLGTGKTKRTLLTVGGASPKVTAVKSAITDTYVPVGERSFHVDKAQTFKPGDTVRVIRNGNKDWIHELSMDSIVQRPGSTEKTQQWTAFTMEFDRVVTKVENDVVTVDAPIMNSIDTRWGGGVIVKYDDSPRIQQVGVEKLRIDTEFDPKVTKTDKGKTYLADENHVENFLVFNSVENAWARELTGVHLSISLVVAGRDSKWITFQDNKVIDMVSTLDGGLRYSYKYSGQLALTQRCTAETARHAFIVDSRVLGPNVFLDSKATDNHATSEPHHRWSVGGLFDNVEAPIAFQDRGWMGTGHGWSGANYVAWNTTGDLTSQKPPTAQNYSIGHVGKKTSPFLPNKDDKRPREDGFWDSFGKHVTPRSLYLQQLEERLGKKAVDSIQRTDVGGGVLDAASET